VLARIGCNLRQPGGVLADSTVLASSVQKLEIGPLKQPLPS
jgi:hypothetical protein